MCGIAGEIGPRASAESVRTMIDALAHRGPDAVGVAAIGELGVVGMCRLRIRGPHCELPVRLSGHSSTVAYNGEIYALETPHAKYVPRSLQQEIKAFMRVLGGSGRLDGMYAAAEFDEQQGRVRLERDGLGIKPLYLAAGGESVRFSSEIRGLLAVSGTPRVDPRSVHEYLAAGRALAGRTWFTGIDTLSPGMREIHRGSERSTEDIARLETTAACVDDLEEALYQSVSACMLADVPIALALSGGVDSSVIAEMLARQGREDVTTFSITVDTGEGDHCSRLDRLGLSGDAWKKWRHEVVHVSPETLIADLRAYIRHTCRPTRMSSAPLYFALGRAVHAQGIKVLLCGEGADEQLFGYNSYQYFAGAHGADTNYVELLHRYYIPKEREQFLQALLTPKAFNATVERLRQEWASLVGDSIEATVRASERYFRLQPLLDRTDEALMAHSVEGRMPFLHGDVPRVTARYSLDDCISAQTTKIPLRDGPAARLAARYQRKTNFRAPLSIWIGAGFRADFARLCEQVRDQFEEIGIRADGVELVAHYALQANGNSAARELLFSLYTLALWCEDAGHPGALV